MRDNVQKDLSGTFTLKLRYTVTSSNNKLVLFVNGEKVGILELNQCGSMSDWHIVTQQIALKQGMNQIEIKAASALGSSVYLDHFTVEGIFGEEIVKPVELDANGYCFQDLFEDVDFDWVSRGSSKLGLSGRIPYQGGNSLLVF